MAILGAGGRTADEDRKFVLSVPEDGSGDPVYDGGIERSDTGADITEEVRTGLGVAQPLTAADAPVNDDTLTIHRDGIVSVSSSSYHTILDLAGEHDLLGGVINAGNQGGVRITIDGDVVVNIVNQSIGQDTDGNSYNAVNIPPCRSTTSLKVETYNSSGNSQNHGWNVIARAL